MSIPQVNQPTVKISALEPGETVRVCLKSGDPEHDDEEWLGRIEAIDLVGLRVRCEKVKSLRHVYSEPGVTFWPWLVIAGVEVVEAGQ